MYYRPRREVLPPLEDLGVIIMLTRIITLSWLLWATVFPVIALAQNSNGKVVVIHYEAVIRECSEGQRAFADFDKKVAAKRAKLGKKNNELLTLRRQLVEQAGSLNEQAQRTLSQNIEVKDTQMKREQEDAQKEFSAIQQEIFRRIALRFGPVLQKYATEQGISMIVDSSKPTNQVFFVNPAIEITGKIIKIFDAALATDGASASQ